MRAVSVLPRIVDPQRLREETFRSDKTKKDKTGVVLLSGGLDSATVAWFARTECDKLYAMTFDYGQTHRREIQCALELGALLKVKAHRLIELPFMRLTGGSSLVGDGSIPKEGLTGGIPSTWVPQRNSIFLAIAFSWAEVVGADRLYAGMNSVDYSGYPDCRPEFIKAVNSALNLASKRFVETGRGIAIVTPLMNLSKKRIVSWGLELGVPYQKTTSCYSGEEEACGSCDSCLIRRKAFRGLGLEDPIRYKEE